MQKSLTFDLAHEPGSKASDLGGWTLVFLPEVQVHGLDLAIFVM